MNIKDIPVLFLIFIVAFSSCESFKKEQNPEDFFNSLDAYPVFENCEGIEKKADALQCFEETIVSHIQKDIDTMSIPEGAYVNNEAIFVYLDIKKNGTCALGEIDDLHKVDQDLPHLAHVIEQSILTLPEFTPAQKRGMSVNSRFMIPLTILKE
jgi:hypothetical protein